MKLRNSSSLDKTGRVKRKKPPTQVIKNKAFERQPANTSKGTNTNPIEDILVAAIAPTIKANGATYKAVSLYDIG